MAASHCLSRCRFLPPSKILKSQCILCGNAFDLAMKALLISTIALNQLLVNPSSLECHNILRPRQMVEILLTTFRVSTLMYSYSNFTDMFPKVLLTMISTGSDKGLASQQVTNVNHYLNPNGLLPTGLPATLNCLPVPQRPRDAMITSLWRQDDVKTSFWRKNYVILALSARWGTILYCTYERMMMWCTGAYIYASLCQIF